MGVCALRLWTCVGGASGVSLDTGGTRTPTQPSPLEGEGELGQG